MKKNWTGRQVRHVLKSWYYLDHHFNQLTLNDLKYMAQFYFRMSYLTRHDQQLLAKLFYYPRGQQPRLTDVVRKNRLNYLKFNYAVHKPERKLKKYRQSPNLSKSTIQGIQFRQLADAFRSIIKIFQSKFAAYPNIDKLDKVSNEDFKTCRKWPRSKVERILAIWCRVVKNPKKYPRHQISLVRQLIFRLTYLPRLNYMILKQYYYYPTYRQQRNVRSEHLAQSNHIYLGKLLLYRLHGLEKLRIPRRLPKMSFTPDERWQINNDSQTIHAIIHQSFQH